MSESPLSRRARLKIKAQMTKDAQEKHVAQFQKRMNIAKEGVAALKAKNYKKALENYFIYIELLKRQKDVKELTPQSFDPIKDAAEMLMVTGVYWDLSTIYDKMGDQEKGKLKYYLDKFFLFSKGTVYEKLSQEMLRKFLTNENPNNRAMFKEIFVKLGGGKCFIATAVEEHCEPFTVTTLKRFRDDVLSRSLMGRNFIRFYYWIGPFIAIRLIRSSELRQKKIARLLGRLSNVISYRFFPDGKCRIADQNQSIPKAK